MRAGASLWMGGIWVCLWAVLSCAQPEREGGPSPPTSSGAPDGPLPTRPEAVAVADGLVSAAAAKNGTDSEHLLRAAARLRERLWRIEGREVDALEALEQLNEIISRQRNGACEAALHGAVLKAELNHDFLRAFRDVSALTTSALEPRCAERAAMVLDMLAAYEPEGPTLAQKDSAVDEAGSPGTLRDSESVARRTARSIVVRPPVSPSGGGRATVSRIEHYGSPDTARVVAHLTAPQTFEVGQLPAQADAPPRVFVDIGSTDYRGEREIEVGGLLKRVRVGNREGGGLRIVLDLGGEAFQRVFYLPEPFRLVIDVSKRPPWASEAAGPRAIRRVALDPGHGGHDPGAVGPRGLREKDVTLDIAHRAGPLIAQELGISTLLTRDTDVYVPLDERAAKANAFGADLFVSIHCNASADPSARGIMTFVLDESEDPLAMHVAARENAASPAAAAELADALRRVMDRRGLAQSLHVAELLQRASVASVGSHYDGVRDLGAKRAGFYVLAGAHMPAVLYEVSFLSNAAEEARLNTADYRQKLADAIVNAVRAYRDGL